MTRVGEGQAEEGLGPGSPLTELSGIGPARAKQLAGRGLVSLWDLALFLPRRLCVWPEVLPIVEARRRVREEVRVEGEIRAARLTRLPRRRSLFVVRLADASGELEASFFNQPWLRDRYVVGGRIEVIGRWRLEKGERFLVSRSGSPESPLPRGGVLSPTYPEVPGFSDEMLAKLARRVLELLPPPADPLPAEWRAAHGLPALAEALLAVHGPRTVEGYRAGRRRALLEPLIALQAHLARTRAGRRGAARALAREPGDEGRVLAALPYALTAGQAGALEEILRDLASTRPMRRLLQGDVGCGKTAVAASAAALVARAGGQAAFLAPTELLAEQHQAALAPLLERLGVASVLLTASLKRAERRRVLAALASGEAGLAFGTHALLGEDVRFARLDLAIIDEQQRFGVGQRLSLTEKGRDVHLLLLTATPIPRTLAHTLYGDLDTSLIEDRPGGRGKVGTRWVRGKQEERLLAFLDERLSQEERVYWVCPRLEHEEEQELGEEGESSAAASAERRHRELAQGPLARHGLALVHGRLEARERAARLAAFRSGAVRLLVATTVIEVGVDVPEATVLVVEGAERFGLSQLHQLRGRVGRGARDSWCLLLGRESARERFELLERESSGFLIAEQDLALRGMGDLLGLRQSGMNEEGLSEDSPDLELLMLARELVRTHPDWVAGYAEPAAASVTP